MDDFKIQKNFFSFSSVSVKSSTKNFSKDFKSLLNEKIFDVPADFENYRCGLNFGDGMNFSFPPDDSPNYFKNAWYEVTSKMNFEERICIFNSDVTTAIRYGYYYSMDYEFNSVDFEKDFNAMNSRVENFGAVGCLELAIRSTEQNYNDNVRGENEQKFITNKFGTFSKPITSTFINISLEKITINSSPFVRVDYKQATKIKFDLSRQLVAELSCECKFGS